jgi:hypothetical protein
MVGSSFFPLYKVIGPMIFFLSLMLLVWGAFRLMITILIRVIVIVTVGAQSITRFLKKIVFLPQHISGHRHDRELWFFLFDRS